MNRDVHTGSRPRPGFLLSRSSPKAAALGRQHGVDDGRIRPSRTSSTKKPIDAFDQMNTVAASRLWELGDALSRVLGQRMDTPDN